MCLQKSFENTVGKGEIACNEQFLLFALCFLLVSRPFCFFHQIRNCCLQTLSIWKNLKFVVWERVKPSPHNPKYNDPEKVFKNIAVKGENAS